LPTYPGGGKKKTTKKRGIRGGEEEKSRSGVVAGLDKKRTLVRH